MTLTVPILTKTIHAAHDWQPHSTIYGGSVDQCSRCRALRSHRFGHTHYTVPDCQLEHTNIWYQVEQQCYTWGKK
jgi:hypothetical protein